MSTNNKQQTISSPLSTGGAGTFFEQHVDAFYLSLLVVRGIPPIIKDTLLSEVHFQTNHLGWNTDDLMLVGLNSKGEKRKLLIQVKRKFTISAINTDSKKAFIDFWNDYKSNSEFDRKADRLALIVLRGTNTLLSDFNSLLDCARASIDGEDFDRRLKISGLISSKAKDYASTIKSIITDGANDTVSSDEFCNFLSLLHVISLDLNTATSQNEGLIKSLLAASSSEVDPLAAANATWSELLQFITSEDGGMPASASYPYMSLPENIRLRHGSRIDTGPLQSLKEHSQITVDSIETTIAGSIKIQRTELRSKLDVAVNTSQVVLISSHAGYGKSALAKELYEHLSENAICLAFRAEEFTTSHIDNTLFMTQAGITAQRLFALLSGHSSVTIFVESIERLLEASVRDAFSDLLGLAKTYKNIRLIFTCRDYSITTIQSSLLEQKNLEYYIVDVPELSDKELDQVGKANANIAIALKNDRLKKLLRSPYMLNKAARMDWSDTSGSSHVDEAIFRQKCWSEVIRFDSKTLNGINRRREKVFLEICIRRARALEPYVRCDDLDSEALQGLINDDLITILDESSVLGSPSHDVLEDWATIQWLDREYLLGGKLPSGLVGSIEGLPALRRGYRKWLSEKLISEPGTTDEYIISSFVDASLPAYFRDDTLVCMLLSDSSQDFLTRQAEVLLKNDANLLIRVIHLLRIACKSTPHWLNNAKHLPSVFLHPDGDAWAAVISIVKDSINILAAENISLILGLVDDWSNLVAWNNPEPDGFFDVGVIIYRLLPELDGYRRDSNLKRALKILIKIPKSNPEEFVKLIDRACNRDREDTIARELSETLLPEMGSTFCCRDFPDEVIRLTKSIFLLAEKDLEKARRDYNYSSSTNVEPHLGIRHYALNNNLYPPSALRGPFNSLLTYHPNKAVKFLVEILNHACEWYGEQKWPHKPLEKPWKITLKLSDGEEVEQYLSGRLWGMYRGYSVGSHFLESALMALESWLLAIADNEKIDLEEWLVMLIKSSNNAAITAVVASVCIAHPDKAGKAGLAILSSKDLILMDRSRMVNDQSHVNLSGMFPNFNVMHDFYNSERKKSDTLPHRSNDLETLAVKMQLTSLREQVWQVIDQHRADLPSINEQTEEDRMWRLALHRMDVRGYRPIKAGEDEISVDVDNENRVYYGPGMLEEDVQEVVDKHAPVIESQGKTMRLFNWGYGSWSRQESETIDVSQWQEMLDEAKSYREEPDEMLLRGGPGFIAATCVRDSWKSMCEEDRIWCVSKLIEELKSESDSDDYSVRQARGSMHPDRAAAFILPFVLVASDIEKINSQQIIETIAIALTHASTEVQSYAAEGIGCFLHAKATEFMLKCVGALAIKARMMTEIENKENAKSFDERDDTSDAYRDVALNMRDAIKSEKVDYEKEITQLNFTGWPGQDAAKLILQMFSYTQDLSDSVNFHQKISKYLVEDWVAQSQNSHHQNYEFEQTCRDRLASFVIKAKPEVALRICDPIFSATIEHPKNVGEFIHSLIIEEDKSEGDTTFWLIWQKFADLALGASWIGDLDSRWGYQQDLINQLFLGTSWKDNAKHWRRLEGNAYRVDTLMQNLPTSSHAIKAYCQFLHDIGEKSLPKAYVIVASKLTPDAVLDSNSIFHLETLLGRHVYGEPLKLKSDIEVRKSVLQILDHLIEQGSSSAYRMRDDFITPMVQAT